MPIYYSQNCIQTTQNKLKKYIKKIENYYLRDRLKYKYIKKIYIMLKNKKSMMPLLHQDIISFIKNYSSVHKRFVAIHRPSNTTLLDVIDVCASEYESDSEVEVEVESSTESSRSRRGNFTGESEESDESDDSSEY